MKRFKTGIICTVILILTATLPAGTLHHPDGSELIRIENGCRIALWPEGTDGIDSGIPEKSKPCGKRFYNIHNPYMTVYLPDQPNGASVILCAGGAYAYIATGVEGIPVAEKLNRSGITVFVLKYRLPNTPGVDYKHPVPLSDALRAVQWVRYHADTFGLDPGKIGIMGFSAGGHLAAAAGTLFDRVRFGEDSVSRIRSRPDFMCLVYPVITTNPDWTHGCLKSLVREGSESRTAILSNELNVTPETPPAFIVHAKDDESVPFRHSVLMADALKEQGVPVKLKLYEQGGHGFGIGRESTDSAAWTDDFLSWMRKRQLIPDS